MEVSRFCEWLAGRPANHAVKLPGRWVEPLDVAAPEKIRAPYDHESFFLESHVQ